MARVGHEETDMGTEYYDDFDQLDEGFASDYLKRKAGEAAGKLLSKAVSSDIDRHRDDQARKAIVSRSLSPDAARRKDDDAAEWQRRKREDELKRKGKFRESVYDQTFSLGGEGVDDESDAALSEKFFGKHGLLRHMARGAVAGGITTKAIDRSSGSARGGAKIGALLGMASYAKQQYNLHKSRDTEAYGNMSRAERKASDEESLQRMDDEKYERRHGYKPAKS
jgi:hypothetical protein